MMTWLRQHLRALGATLSRLGRAPFATLLNLGVIGTALALPTGFYVALVNVQDLARGWSATPQISVFMALDAPRTQAAAIEKRLAQHAGVARARFVPREQALKELKATSGLADVVESLAHNPLPDAFVVDAREPVPAALEALRDEFKGWPGVAYVQLDSAWAQRLAALMSVGRLAVLMLAALLAFALVAVTFNTIRLQILTQRDEIEVAKLIGATDGYIRRPFLYYGASLGLAGGLAGWAMVWSGLLLIEPGMTELARLYGVALDLHHLAPRDSLSVLALSAGLGWLGAWLSVARHLGAAAPGQK